jgi:hypothetical protein
MSRVVGHEAASGLRLSGEQNRTRYGPDTCRLWTPTWLIKAWVFFVLESRDPVESGPDPTQRGPDPILGVRLAPAEVRSAYMGVRHLPWGSRPTVDTLGYIVFSGHVAALESSTWWGRVLFTT